MVKEIHRINLPEIKEETDLKRKVIKMQYFAQQCRLDVFEMIYKRGNGHWGGSSSSVEILTTLYTHILSFDPKNPINEDRDRLILSKGHAAPILYTLLAHAGFFPLQELTTFRELNSRLQGHPCMSLTPGVDLSTGPLGHGISAGLGMALAARIQNRNYWTFVIVGEGCLNEGQSWEAIMSAAKYKPARLVILVDYNKVQLDGVSENIMPLDPLREKFKAFNLNVSDIIYDGHRISEIVESWEWMKQNHEEPCVVIYKTIKGKGVSFMEGNHMWHGSTIDDESFAKGREEIINSLVQLPL